jgi:hypothetical protein
MSIIRIRCPSAAIRACVTAAVRESICRVVRMLPSFHTVCLVFDAWWGTEGDGSFLSKIRAMGLSARSGGWWLAQAGGLLSSKANDGACAVEVARSEATRRPLQRAPLYGAREVCAPLARSAYAIAALYSESPTRWATPASDIRSCERCQDAWRSPRGPSRPTSA